MSYILNALKKSDRERQQEAPSPLQPLYAAPPSSRDLGLLSRRWLWLLLSGLLILGGLGQWWAWQHWLDRRSHETAGETATHLTPAQLAPSPAPAPAAGEGERPLDPITVQAESFDDWVQHPPQKDQQAAAAQSPAPSALAGGAIDRPPLKIKRDRQKVVMAPREETPVIRQPPPLPAVTARAEAAPAAKQRSDLPYLEDLAPQVRAELPRLQFAGHAYALAPAQRLIVINGMIMREGDQIDAETRLAEITWEGVVIDRKGLLYQVKCY